MDSFKKKRRCIPFNIPKGCPQALTQLQGSSCTSHRFYIRVANIPVSKSLNCIGSLRLYPTRLQSLSLPKPLSQHVKYINTQGTHTITDRMDEPIRFKPNRRSIMIVVLLLYAVIVRLAGWSIYALMVCPYYILI